MKKILQFALLCLGIAITLASCSGSKNLSSANSSVNVSRGKFTGTWVLNQVSYEGIVQSAVTTVFDQAPPAAFTGSTWRLTNSGNGIYTLNNGTSQTIYWSIYNGDAAGQMFQFKKIYQGDKAKNVDTGYRLLVSNNDGRNMTLKSPVNLGNGTGYVVYTFTKQ
ncbi:hypothetical protein HH214_05460 [Mucilaginibacter robiniae]|uniref:Lipocalin-like domain-containing protein n=1 Tax=Mucilaginibacter robiniae TaxID=2728022 RepID=A0A7L5DW85_9SPHI|nr:hypothetical protein [Mucilaginibacter robiniae]QJD95355.1 hypothetical protein HH214_05460 [Mucilaginibacter robiniae]